MFRAYILHVDKYTYVYIIKPGTCILFLPLLFPCLPPLPSPLSPSRSSFMYHPRCCECVLQEGHTKPGRDSYTSKQTEEPPSYQCYVRHNQCLCLHVWPTSTVHVLDGMHTSLSLMRSGIAETHPVYGDCLTSRPGGH